MDRLEIVSRHIECLLAQKDRVILAIDGNCTAGKSTLAAMLAQRFDCNVFHMDDFFLRPEQRTAKRFAQPGGNVDYERFREEILLPLQAGESFSYRPFDCGSFALGEPVFAPVKKLNIIEGTYALHPYFGEPYDGKILLTVDRGEQRRRVLQRPEFLHSRFFEQWIPMEDRYFAEFQIAGKADLTL